MYFSMIECTAVCKNVDISMIEYTAGCKNVY